MTHIVALSGGKDSTAMALRLSEVEQRDYEFICTPTGNELPSMIDHWVRLGELLGKPIRPLVTGVSLGSLIQKWNALPNWRQRWCTRVLKIEPFQAYVAQNMPCTVYVGLRADEADRDGISYDDSAVQQRFPLVEWGWGLGDVVGYLEQRGVSIPPRTDCAACFFQTLGEWHSLWKNHPDKYAQAEEWEAQTGYTFRSPSRDSWPASLVEMRERFQRGDVPKGRSAGPRTTMCSVCAR